MRSYGIELVLDLDNCDASKFTRESIESYMAGLCDLIGMERCELHFWDDLDTPEADRQTEPHAVGTSAVQFILTSTVTIHTLDMLGEVYINIFSCKDFDTDQAKNFSHIWFDGHVTKGLVITRGKK